MFLKFQSEPSDVSVPYAELYTDPQYKRNVVRKMKKLRRVATNCKSIQGSLFRKELGRIREIYPNDGGRIGLYELIGKT